MSHQPERQIDQSDPLAFTDVILPCQFFGAMGGNGLCAEQRLMLAVLVDAINILQGFNRMGSARKRRAFAEAGQWVTTQGRSYPFSFDSVCDALGIDPEMLRERLASLVMGFGMQSRLGGSGRLRLKESSRAQHMTANRVRRRKPPRLAAVRS
ncbi:MAG TPA: hypothetical protein VHY56_11800 [Candidatus Binataceae bacterium]|nr:hypothetical protein [Candidatus Binataceae bacterium]